MPTFKKLIFAPFFLLLFGLLIYQINPILESYDFIFSLSITTFISLLFLSFLISLTSFLFVLFATLSLDWKIVLPVGILASFTPMLFFNPSLAIIFTVGTLVTLLLTYLTLENTMKTYLTFQPAALLGPSIRHLCTLLILVIAVTYFLSLNTLVQQTGFQIPDSLVDATLKFTPQTSLPLDLTNNLIKQTLKDQIQNFLNPYLGFIPAVLAILLFFTLQSLTSLISLLIYPLLWIIFLILEKSGFITFTTEMKPVKKMVI